MWRRPHKRLKALEEEMELFKSSKKHIKILNSIKFSDIKINFNSFY